ncbi:nickel-dependent lactate racemase [Halanaerobium saccharolyticum]|jgi:nickel-dependent lactate racemase|uniref:Nickel-dependent lactate racemase n=1 Tax=Halanaerobium saccharolyticum TaxID=43595 RepID=A0A4R7Z513_9FIRM|nr:nickel-dependent lactate racemase [Halanaerobium saccharolyticum]RAK12745.1 nickel-dependent lactate racemase [Halanaerobium saccharolyticum]TDW02958.1 nickel-dependent lactate racemase [Halanaerobium saccharolyticum]TDX62858.1 nickel-dependent lactate racemase [Halanaerobium saccharolyticum]
MKLKYGRENLEFEIESSRVLDVLKANEKEGLKNPLAEVESALEDPIGTAPLAELLAAREINELVIIVNDVTRYTPYNYLLPPLLKTISEAGIKNEQVTFIVATGVHSPHSDEQNREIFGEEIDDNYNFIHHDCDQDLVDLGQLSTGNQLQINKKVADADFLITTGVILPHYMAGFSGGRKSILPGVAGRESIENNHAMMVEVTEEQPALEANPISREMFEAAEKVGVDFILNVVTNSSREIVQVVAGDYRQAWEARIAQSAEMYHLPLAEKAEAAVVSSGGFPRDINLYQAQKALDHADHAVKKGGTIIWVAECSEGYGEERFQNWMDEAQKPEDNITRIKKKFLIGGHKAFAISKVAAEKEIILISSLSQEQTENIFAKKKDTIQAAVDYLEEKYQGDYSAYIMPQGSLTVPVVK